MRRFFKKIWAWIDDRSGMGEVITSLARHKVPPNVNWSYVFGSATLFCLILQIVTGISLSLIYQPSTAAAYESLQYISNEMPLGSILRGLHYFGASGMILLMGIHMIRVFVTGSYKFPRELHWISGIFLFVLTVAMGFTGQLLRWDDAAIWTTTIAAEQLGRIPFIGDMMAHFMLAGKTVGGDTLSRFFAFHVFIIPAILFGVLGFHLYLVIRNGISEPPKAGRPVNPKTYRAWYESLLEKKGVPFWPDVAWKDVVFSVFVLAVILVLSVYVGPQTLGGAPDPTTVEVTPKPDWYLLWIFAMFALMPHAIESYVIFLGPIIAGLILLSIPFIANKGERSPFKRPWSMAAVIMIVTIIFSFWRMGAKSPWVAAFKTDPLPESVVPPGNAAAARGADLFYQKRCQYCHTIAGYGGQKGPNLTYVAERMNEQIMMIRIVNGGHGMPAYGPSLTNRELHDLVEFLKTRTIADTKKKVE